MCGIAGILRVTPPGEAGAMLARAAWESIPERWLDVLDESIKHRGPDGAGRFRDRVVRADGCVVDVALVHRRLAIIDLADGHQPMVSLGKGQGVITGAKRFSLGEGLGLYEPGEYGWLCAGQSEVRRADRASDRTSTNNGADRASDRSAAGETTDRVAVIFNGCIYNHRELRKELEAAGHVFSTDHSDTEVLVHGWREWGSGLARRLDGMYAGAIWDRARGTLTWLRDFFGEKPLYLFADAGVNAVSSTVPGLLRLGYGVRTTPGAPYGVEVLRGWVQFGWNQATPFEVTQALSGFHESLPTDFPGTDDDRFQAALNPSGQVVGEDAIDAALRRSVCARLEADVPLGCFLSGGLDSALVVKYAAEQRPDIDTFTVRMPAREYDESGGAARTARHLGVSHAVLDCDARPADDLRQLISQLGLPFGDSSLLPAAWVSRAARSAARVALSGDGGDDLFLGYQRHQAMKWLWRLRGAEPEVLHAIGRRLPTAGPKSKLDKVRRLADAARFGGYRDLVAIFPPPLSFLLGLEPARDAGGAFGHVMHYGMTFSSSDDTSVGPLHALRFDRLFYLPEDLMRKSDTASMACALEVRAPFLGREVSTLAMNAPIECLMPHNERKGLLRAVARKYFPAEIVDRPKMGFAIPVGEWFRTNYGGMRDLLLDHLNSAEPFGPDSLGINAMINMDYVRQMLREHDAAGEKSLWPWKGRDHSQRLYMMLVLSIWAKWLGGLRA